MAEAPKRKKLPRSELMFKNKTGEDLWKKPGSLEGR